MFENFHIKCWKNIRFFFSLLMKIIVLPFTFSPSPLQCHSDCSYMGNCFASPTDLSSERTEARLPRSPAVSPVSSTELDHSGRLYDICGTNR